MVARPNDLGRSSLFWNFTSSPFRIRFFNNLSEPCKGRGGETMSSLSLIEQELRLVADRKLGGNRPSRGSGWRCS